MKFVTIVTVGLFIASSASPLFAQDTSKPDMDIATPPDARVSAPTGDPTTQAKYVVPVEIREILEQRAQLKAAEPGGPVPMPTMNARSNQ